MFRLRQLQVPDHRTGTAGARHPADRSDHQALAARGLPAAHQQGPLGQRISVRLPGHAWQGVRPLLPRGRRRTPAVRASMPTSATGTSAIRHTIPWRPRRGARAASRSSRSWSWWPSSAVISAGMLLSVNLTGRDRELETESNRLLHPVQLRARAGGAADARVRRAASMTTATSSSPTTTTRACGATSARTMRCASANFPMASTSSSRWRRARWCSNAAPGCQGQDTAGHDLLQRRSDHFRRDARARRRRAQRHRRRRTRRARSPRADGGRKAK